MLAHLIGRLPPQVDEILLTVSYQADEIRSWAETTTDRGLKGRKLVVVDEPVPLGTGGAVANCLDHLDDTVLVLNGDLLSDVPVERQMAAHKASGALATIALYAVDDPSRFGVVDIRPDGRIDAFVEKPSREEAPSQLVNAGCYLLEPEAVAMIARGRKVSIEREVFPQIAASNRGMHGMAFEGLWIDCGTPESYLEVHGLLGAPSWVAPDAKVAADVALDRCVVLAGAHIDAGAKLVNSIIGPGAHIGSAARVSRSIVGPGASVAPSAEVAGQRIGLRGEGGDPPEAL